MDKKDFLMITTETFREYGFIKIGNQYFLNLNRVVVRVYRLGARFEPNAYCFSYNLCFKDIHEDYEFLTNNDYKNMPEDLGILKNIRTHETRIRNDREIADPTVFYPSEYSSDEWKRLLNDALHREFDPFSQNFVKYVKDNFKPRDMGMCADAYKSFRKKHIFF